MSLNQNIPKKTIFIFLMTYLGVLLPILVVSFFVSHAAATKMNAQIDEKINIRIERTIDFLDSIWASYSNKALELANDTTFLYDRLSNPVTAYKSIEALGSVLNFESYASNLLLYYGDQALYTPRGYLSVPVFLDKYIESQNDYAYFLQLLNEDFFDMCLLEHFDHAGFVLMHYPARVVSYAKGAQSINFMIPYERFASFFSALSAPEQFFMKLEFRNAQSLFLTGKEGKVVSIASRDYQTAREKDCKAFYMSFDSLGIDAEIFYAKNELYGMSWRTQFINDIILTCSLLISAIASIIICNRRIRQLMVLKREIQTDFSGDAKYSGGFEYSYLNQVLRDAFYDKNSKIASRDDQIRRQTAYMLFHGTITERETLNLYLKACGMEIFEEYYFISSLMLDYDETRYQDVCKLLQDHVYYDMHREGKRILFFLNEITSVDTTGQDRMGILHSYYNHLVQMGNTNVHLGASLVYDSLAMAGLAYQEAYSIAEEMLAGAFLDVCAVWEYIEPESVHLMRISESDKKLLSSAIARRDGTAAIKLLARLTRAMNLPGAKIENQSYFRYQILRILVDGQEGNEALIKQAMTADLQIDEFMIEAERIIRMYYFDDKQDRKFDSIVAYIKEHYQESSLSAESVAQQCGVDKTHLSRIFRAKVNMSYIEYLTHLRMEKARELLIHTDMPVTEICSAVGYLDVSSFRKKFKALYNQNLSEFRESRIRIQEDAQSKGTS